MVGRLIGGRRFAARAVALGVCVLAAGVLGGAQGFADPPLLPADLYVTGTADVDNGSCTLNQCASLRDAVSQANSDSAVSTDTIHLPAGTYPITLGTIEPATDGTAIEGAGSGSTIIDGSSNAASTILDLDGGSQSISGVTFANATSNGGGGTLDVGSGTSLTLTDVVIDHSYAADSGGGIAVWQNSTLTMTGGSITSSEAAVFGGAIYVEDGSTATLNSVTLDGNITSNPDVSHNFDLDVGGAIWNAGTLTLNDGHVSNNQSDMGGGLYNKGALTVDGTELDHNRSRDDGGAILNDTGGVLDLTGANLHNNTAAVNAGGALANDGGDATITDTTFDHNVANFFGTIISRSPLSMTGGEIVSGSGDAGTGGLGVAGNSTATLTRVVLRDNSGAVYTDAGTTTTLAQSMVTLNRGSFAISSAGDLNLTSSTVADNAGHQLQIGGAGHVTFENTLIAALTHSGADDCSLPGLGASTSDSFSISDRPGQCEVPSTNAFIADPANATTGILALNATSAAVDSGDDTASVCGATDIVGTARPQGTHCDVGAYEVPYRSLTLVKAGAGASSSTFTASPAAPSYADGASVDLTATPGTGYAATITGAGCGPTVQMTADLTCTASFDTEDPAPDAFTFTPVTNAVPGVLQSSDTWTIAGTNVSSPISIAGGEYSVNDGAFTSVAGTVSAGDVVRARRAASSSFNTTVTATVTVGGVDAAFSITTRSTNADADLNTLSIDPGALSPDFSAGTTDYTAALPHSVSQLDVMVILDEASASATVNGEAVTLADGAGVVTVDLADGHTVIPVVVHASDGTTTKTYTIDVTRDAGIPVTVDIAGDGRVQVTDSNEDPVLRCPDARFDPPRALPDPSCTYTFDGTGDIALEARANPGAVFAGWSGDCSGTDSYITLSLSTATTCTATFTTLDAQTFTVTTTGDSNDGACTVDLCSLRDAWNAAIAAGNATITIPDLGGPITLTGDDGEGCGCFSLPRVPDGSSISVVGTSQAATVIQGSNSADSLIGVAGGALSLSQLTLTDGPLGGIAVFGGESNLGSISLTDVTVTGNGDGELAGGGIYVGAGSTLTASRSTVSQNNGAIGGGIYGEELSTISLTDTAITGNGATDDAGGGIATDGLLTITGGSITGNYSSWQGGGLELGSEANATLTGVTIGGAGNGNVASDSGGGIASSGTLTMNGGSLLGNQSDNLGGGIFVDYDGLVTLNNVTVGGPGESDGNTASDSGGGIASDGELNVSGGTIEGNASDAGGGVLTEANDPSSFDNVTITGNHARQGGGILADDQPTITNSSIDHNTATEGGGGAYLTDGGTITDTAVDSNTADYGAGIRVVGEGALEFTGGSISGNSAQSSGGGVSVAGNAGGQTLTFTGTAINGNTAPDAPGAAIENGDAIVELTNVTLTGNTGATVLSGNSDAELSEFHLSYSTIAGNTGLALDAAELTDLTIDSSVVSGNTLGNCNGAASTTGHDVLDDSSCGSSGTDQVVGDAGLGTLRDDGTLPILSTSPALDAGSTTSCPETDARGTARPQGSNCDAGAFELGQYRLTLHTTGAGTGTLTATPDQSLFFEGASAVTLHPVAQPGSGFDGYVEPSCQTNLTLTTDLTCTATFVQTASANANLSELSLSTGTLSPGFSPSAVSYSASVANGVSTVVITAAAADPGATVTIDGSPAHSRTVSLALGENAIPIVVTAPSTTTKQYTVTITRAAAAPPVNGEAAIGSAVVALGPSAPADPPQVVVVTSSVSVSVSSTVFTTPVTMSVTVASSSAATPSGTSGFSAGSVVVDLQITDGDGHPVTQFASPLVLHFGVQDATFVPAYSKNGTDWVPIPELKTASLPSGQDDGFFRNDDGSVDVYTRHATLFAVLRDAAPPTVPKPYKSRGVNGRVVLQWAASTDNSGNVAYVVYANGQRIGSVTDGTTLTTNVVAPTGKTTYTVVAIDPAGNTSASSAAGTATRLAKPAGVPKVVPAWAFELLAWQQSKHGARPAAAPKRLPAWYAKWAAWRKQPFTVG